MYLLFKIVNLLKWIIFLSLLHANPTWLMDNFEKSDTSIQKIAGEVHPEKAEEPEIRNIFQNNITTTTPTPNQKLAKMNLLDFNSLKNNFNGKINKNLENATSTLIEVSNLTMTKKMLDQKIPDEVTENKDLFIKEHALKKEILVTSSLDPTKQENTNSNKAVPNDKIGKGENKIESLILNTDKNGKVSKDEKLFLNSTETQKNNSKNSTVENIDPFENKDISIPEGEDEEIEETTTKNLINLVNNQSKYEILMMNDEGIKMLPLQDETTENVWVHMIPENSTDEPQNKTLVINNPTNNTNQNRIERPELPIPLALVAKISDEKHVQYKQPIDDPYTIVDQKIGEISSVKNETPASQKSKQGVNNEILDSKNEDFVNQKTNLSTQNMSIIEISASENPITEVISTTEWSVIAETILRLSPSKVDTPKIIQKSTIKNIEPPSATPSIFQSSSIYHDVGSGIGNFSDLLKNNIEPENSNNLIENRYEKEAHLAENTTKAQTIFELLNTTKVPANTTTLIPPPKNQGYEEKIEESENSGIKNTKTMLEKFLDTEKIQPNQPPLFESGYGSRETLITTSIGPIFEKAITTTIANSKIIENFDKERALKTSNTQKINETSGKYKIKSGQNVKTTTIPTFEKSTTLANYTGGKTKTDFTGEHTEFNILNIEATTVKKIQPESNFIDSKKLQSKENLEKPTLETIFITIPSEKSSEKSEEHTSTTLRNVVTIFSSIKFENNEENPKILTTNENLTKDYTTSAIPISYENIDKTPAYENSVTEKVEFQQEETQNASNSTYKHNILSMERPVEPSGYSENEILPLPQKAQIQIGGSKEAVGYTTASDKIGLQRDSLSQKPDQDEKLSIRKNESIIKKSKKFSARQKWKPYVFNCSTEIDDNGTKLCTEWAKAGYCGEHKATMFLFCRLTCLCTGPPPEEEENLVRRKRTPIELLRHEIKRIYKQ